MNDKEIILKELYRSIERFEKRNIKLTALSRRFSFYRLGIFLGGLTLILLSFFFFGELLTWIMIVINLIVFGIVAGMHNKINNGIKKNRHWIKIKEAQAARIKIDWDNIPENDTLLPDDKHSFDADLSTTGKYSLHRLIDNTVSHEGSYLLKKWLTSEEPSLQNIIERQELVKEIKPLHHFRNKLILNSMLASSKKLESTRFIEWLKSGSSIQKLTKLVNAGWVLIFINVVLFLLFIFGFTGPFFSIGLLFYAALYFFNLDLVRDSFEKAMHTESELGKFYSILSFIETYNYGRNERLRKFCAPLLAREKTPAKHFKSIKSLIYALSFQKNPLTALLLNIVIPWDFLFTLKLEKEKEKLADNLSEWLDTWHQLEAVNAIAEFASLNPEYSFPVLSADTAGEVLNAEGAAHPLIRYDLNVINDFSIKSLGEISIITGSNMSGKSTFLKTIGSNLVLAYAGAPVNAAKFKTSLFRIFTCIKIDDSVVDGISYFYAEVKRLKHLLNRLQENSRCPLFFLVDEIFRGTNNLERLTGSRAYIKALGGKYGTGLISTHDLELVKLEQEISHIRNFHFREEVVNGKMLFDYKIRSGPSPTTNALKIMKLEGLPVD